MNHRWVAILIIIGLCTLQSRAGKNGSQAQKNDDDRAQAVRALLERSRLVKDLNFRVPLEVWKRYAHSISGEKIAATAPVGAIWQSGAYKLTLDAEGRPQLTATIRLQVLDHRQCSNMPLLTAALGWKELTVAAGDEKPGKISLATVDGYMRFTPPAAGRYVISARADLKAVGSDGERVGLDIPETVQTSLDFSSPRAWEVCLDGDGRTLRGSAAGTAGVLNASSRRRLSVNISRLRRITEREPVFRVSGDVAWNLDAAGQDVTADMRVDIIGGKTDQLELTLPASAARVSITGPSVRQVRTRSGGATVHLKGRISGAIALTVRFELPAVRGGAASLSGLGVRGGRWSGGTLVLTNSAGGREVLADSAAGLGEMALADVGKSASAILSAPAAAAYSITSPSWSVSVDVIDVGAFALTETIADLAHYELAFRADGAVMCKASYEVRNRARQFLHVSLPPGAQILLARVNEKLVPMARPQATAGNDVYIMPLVRSKASVMGLVSFPVEVVFIYRAGALDKKGNRGRVQMALPRINAPIAYAWCEAYVPDAMKVSQWSGPLKRVDRYSSETATVQMAYGRSELAEGYDIAKRHRPDSGPVTPRQITGTFLDDIQMDFTLAPSKKPSSSMTQPSAGQQYTLGKNYWRSGKEAYDRGELDEAQQALGNVMRLRPNSTEAFNAERLLANIDLARGRRSMKSKSEKAAGAKVLQDIRGVNVKLEMQQQDLLTKGFKAARAGKSKAAAEQFAAAEALGSQLLAQGGSSLEQNAILREARKELSQVREAEKDKLSRTLGRVSELKKAGKYDAALKLAKTARFSDINDSYLIPGASRGGRGGQNKGDLGKDIEELTILAAKDKARKRDQSGFINKVSVDSKLKVKMLRYPEDWNGVAEPGSQLGDGKPADHLETRSYNIRDLIVPTPGDRVSERIGLGNTSSNSNRGGGGGGTFGGGGRGGDQTREERAKEIADLVRETIAPGTWDSGAAIRPLAGQLVVTQTSEHHEALLDLLKQLQEARGMQVDKSSRAIALQRAGGQLKDGGLSFDGYSVKPFDGDRDGAGDKNGRISDELTEFIARNYKWAMDNKSPRLTLYNGPAVSKSSFRSLYNTNAEDLINKLRINLGQKVAVSSMNVNASAPEAAQLGVKFQRGVNNVTYGIADEAQFRTLMEHDSRNRSRGAIVDANRRGQETIVGTDAFLSNEMTANLSYAADGSNRFDVNDNPIEVSHEKYLILVNPDNSLTAVRAGQMQNWREQSKEIQFVEAPQDINVPGVGRLERFEKTLIKPDDRLIISADYTWKGTS